MWPASESTTMPSGIFRPSVRIVFSSVPSGLQDNTRPLAASRKNKRATVVFGVGFGNFGSWVIVSSSFTSHDLGVVTFLWNRRTDSKAFNLIGTESEFAQHLVIVLAELRSAARRCLRHAVDFDRAAHGTRQLFAAAFDRHNDFVCEYLRIRGYVHRRLDDSVSDAGAFENVVPVCQRLRSEDRIQVRRELP